MNLVKACALIFLLGFNQTALSQYCGAATTNVAITPTTTVQYSTTYSSGRRAFSFNAIAGNEYTFSTVGQTTVDTYLRLYSTGTGGTLLAQSDDYNNTQSEITWYCATSGTYSVLLTRWSASTTCNTLNANARIKYQMGSTAGSTIVAIGNGEGVVYQVPVNHYYKYGWSEMIYLKSEINTVGDITKIRFQVEPTLPAAYVAENQKIYMAHTTLSTLPSVLVKEDAQTNYASSNYTLVFSGTITWNIGWVEIVLTTPFPWNNTDNLLIKYENREGTFSANYPMFYYTAKTATIGYNYQDASYPTSDGTRDGFRPNLKLAITESTDLPIELMEFNGISSGPTNNLFWSTASEYNTSHFNLQKSRDGAAWSTVATLNAAGNSTSKIEYFVADYQVEAIVNYYRLVQYDLNGVYSFYGPIAINNMDMPRVLVKRVTMRGEEVPLDRPLSTGIYFDIYSDGFIKKVQY
ncbi:hypothetical protein UFOVP699_138 [uncultured Caudovirales phage]|uniref:Uncharacterized protein n=1 Tax=uncultured Caudovirales phage TaxID=2100421 RepID=A0A6J5NL19_9CAUD|nr:hypothetical protein UFOVP699_138 [uncultured Caudovirales phage]